MAAQTSPVVVSARGLGKTYHIASDRDADPASTAGEAIIGSLRRIVRRRENTQTRPFPALTDLNFDIKSGEVVGIIGRNGAGKSTLLKVLSRITPPTTGRVVLHGRVGSLLEVGTGFHPELTGRENIYLSGAILGMRRGEITAQFAAITDFAEIGPFLDTPVKRYSSGMYVRLAFAVAAHLNPEILIVDEVLAVGDTAFQKKCLGKMQDAAQSGRTVLFVSHSMASVRALCSRALLLEKGRIACDGPVETVVKVYLAQNGASANAQVTWEPGAGSPELFFTQAFVENERGAKLAGAPLDVREGFALVVEYAVTETLRGVRIGWEMQTEGGVVVCGANNPHWPRQICSPGIYQDRCVFPPHLLNENRYIVNFCADIPNDRVLHLTGFDLIFDGEDVEGYGDMAQKLSGVLRPRLSWQSAPVAGSASANEGRG